jgi:branched-chain amino acid transport system substrate-binding protein
VNILTPWRLTWVVIGFLVSILAIGQASANSNRSIKVVGWGALSGPYADYGVNSRAALTAAIEKINSLGGVELADGTYATIDLIAFEDTECNQTKSIEVLKSAVRSQGVLAAFGGTCSSECLAVFQELDRWSRDKSNASLLLPVLADTCIRPGLARISDWAFRNVANEIHMYDSFFGWIRENYPEVRTFGGGVEFDDPRAYVYHTAVFVQMAIRNGFKWLGPVVEGAGPNVKQGMKALQAATSHHNWRKTETEFRSQVFSITKHKPDMILITGHTRSTCGFLKELRRQVVDVKLVVGFSPFAARDSLARCGRELEGMLVPTTFAEMTSEGINAAARVASHGGVLNHQSAAAWENAFFLYRAAIEADLMATEDTLLEDRLKLKQALTNVSRMLGLIGPIRRDGAGEAARPYVVVRAVNGQWSVVYDPRSAHK